MKFTPEVVAALATLRDNAENDFERHRLDVLERDLTNPPQVEVLDDTHQRFNGSLYYKSKKGHFTTAHQIHRDVWSYFNGEIPQSNYNIHHIDRNPANNDISNLQLLTHPEHRKTHGAQIIEKICPNCKKIFIVKSYSKQKYCSITCAVKCRPKTKKPRPQKTCPVCGKKFILKPKHLNQNCCSRSCAATLRNRKNQTNSNPLES